MRKAMFGSVLALFFALPVPTAAAATIAWTDQFGTDKTDVAWGVIATPTDVYAAGSTAGALPGRTSAGGVDGFLRHLDASGNEIWTAQFGTGANDYTFEVASDATGLYVLGVTEGTFTGQTSAGGRDAYLMKFDLSGNELWTVQFGTSKDDSPSNVVADASGVYVAGNTRGTFPGVTHRGREDVFLTRFDASGNQDWTQEFGSNDYDFGYANATGPDGVYVNGFTYGRLPGQRARGGWDAYVGLFGTDGSRTWLRQFGTRGNEFGLGIAADATGVYVSGDTDGVFKGQRDRPGSDAFVRKFAPADCASLWTDQFGTRGDDSCSAVALAGTELECAGQTNGVFKGETPAGGTDGFAKSLDAMTGDGGPALQFGSPKFDTAHWAAGAPNVLYVVGETNGTLPGETAFGGGDAFVMKIDVSVA